MHGIGVYTWPDGRKYDGSWQNDKVHGIGVFTNSKKEIRRGKWEDGEHIEWLD